MCFFKLMFVSANKSEMISIDVLLKQIYFFVYRKSKIASKISSLALEFSKFLIQPTPPGMNKTSKSLGIKNSIDFTFVILADSYKTFVIFVLSN